MGLANMSSTQSCGSSSISKPAVSDQNQTKHLYFSEFVLGTRVHYRHMHHAGPKAIRPKNLRKDATISLITTTWYDNSRAAISEKCGMILLKGDVSIGWFLLAYLSTLRLTWLEFWIVYLDAFPLIVRPFHTCQFGGLFGCFLTDSLALMPQIKLQTPNRGRLIFVAGIFVQHPARVECASIWPDCSFLALEQKLFWRSLTAKIIVVGGKLNILIQIHQQISQTFHSAAPHGLVVVTCASSSPSRITLKGRKALKGLQKSKMIIPCSKWFVTVMNCSNVPKFAGKKKNIHINVYVLHIGGVCACVVTIHLESNASTRSYKASISLAHHPNSPSYLWS